MYNSITTSEENRAIVTELTNKFNLGTENIIARLALSFSLAHGTKLNLKDIRDSKGKTYSTKVLFGNHLEIYEALICQHYKIHRSDKDIPKYIKLHVDHGLQEMKQYSNSDGIDFLINAIDRGMEDQLTIF